jgi:hypothetical protein
MEIFISPNGCDDHDGSPRHPFATLERARDAVRAAKQKAAAAWRGATVWLSEGIYERRETFELTAEDSGTAAGPVTYRALPGETARLVGGVRIPQFTKTTDPDVLERIYDGARDFIWEADLCGLGIAEFGALTSRGFNRRAAVAHMELFFDRRPMTLARWPNQGGFAHIADVPEAGQHDDGHGTMIGQLENGFFYSGDQPQRWRDHEQMWIHGYWTYDWANSYERIASIDREKRLIKTVPPHGNYGFLKGQRIYFLNILEELDAPGEYYVDVEKKKLYFRPPAPVNEGEAILSMLSEPMVRMTGVAHVRFGGGLTFEASRAHAIDIAGGENCIVTGCIIRNLGTWGVKCEGGHNHCIQACDIHDTGDGGVSIGGGDRKTLEACGHTVENCHFHDIGHWSKCYVPAIHMGGVGCRAAHNLIHEHPHCAILFVGNEHIIEYNHIHHVCLETGDVGAIYTGRDWTYQGNVIRFNFIERTGGYGMGSNGVYLDDNVSGIYVHDNIFYRVPRAGFIGGGRDNRFENNLMVDCDPAMWIDGRGLHTSSDIWRNMVYNDMRKRLEEMNHHQPPYSTRYPQLMALDAYLADDKGVPPGNDHIRCNLFVGGTPPLVDWGAKPEMIDFADNIRTDTPGFVTPRDPRGNGFALRPDAPVLAKGFRPIPFDQIGIVPEQEPTDGAN